MWNFDKELGLIIAFIEKYDSIEDLIKDLQKENDKEYSTAINDIVDKVIDIHEKGCSNEDFISFIKNAIELIGEEDNIVKYVSEDKLKQYRYAMSNIRLNIYNTLVNHTSKISDIILTDKEDIIPYYINNISTFDSSNNYIYKDINTYISQLLYLISIEDRVFANLDKTTVKKYINALDEIRGYIANNISCHITNVKHYVESKDKNLQDMTKEELIEYINSLNN